jgi:hypothetical protein
LAEFFDRDFAHVKLGDCSASAAAPRDLRPRAAG